MKFVFDLDGTICFGGKPLSVKMVQSLERLAGEGHELVFASARPIRDLLPVLPLHMREYPMVGGNGGFVYNGGRQVCASALDPVIAKRILELMREFDAQYLVDSYWNYSYTGHPEHPIRKNLDPEGSARNVRIDELDEIVKIVILHSRNALQLLRELQAMPVMIYMHGTENIIDISPAGIDKWRGLQALGFKPYDYIAFGNDANDVPLFRFAGRSICVGEHAELKGMATESVANDEEAVAERIERIADQLRTAPQRLCMHGDIGE